MIWTGLGFLVAVITFCCLLASEYITEVLSKNDQYYQLHAWPKCIGFLLSGIILTSLGRYLHSKPTRTLIDPQTNEVVLLRPSHTLFFVPMRYWGSALIVLSVIVWLYDKLT